MEWGGLYDVRVDNYSGTPAHQKVQSQGFYRLNDLKNTQCSQSYSSVEYMRNRRHQKFFNVRETKTSTKFNQS